MVSPDDDLVEHQLLKDRATLPGAIAAWQKLSPKVQKKWIRRLARSEGRRHEFEELLVEDPEAWALWLTYPITEQREVLSTIDYLRFWPRQWEMRRTIRGVRRGSDYRRVTSSEANEFIVGLTANYLNGGGRLIVAPGYLEVRSTRLTKRFSGVKSVRHHGSNVDLYTARLVPPWFNCSVIVSDGQRSVLGCFPIWTRKHVAMALQEAGFNVIFRTSLFGRGYYRVTF